MYSKRTYNYYIYIYIYINVCIFFGVMFFMSKLFELFLFVSDASDDQNPRNRNSFIQCLAHKKIYLATSPFSRLLEFA